MMLKSQLLKASSWLAIAAVLARLSAVLSSILIARWLGKDQFGLVAITQSTVLMFGGFLGVGLGTTATKVVAEHRAKNGHWSSGTISLLELGTLGCAFLAALLLLLCRTWISEAVVGSSALVSLLVPGAWLLVGTALNFFQVGLLAGLEEFRGTATANAISAAVTLPLVVVGVWFGGSTGAVASQALGMTCCCVIFQLKINQALARRDLVRSYSGLRPQVARVCQLAFPILMLSSINAPIDWTCLALLARSDYGAGEVAVFSAANQWCLMLRFLPMTLAAALLPAVIQAASEGKGATKKLMSFALLVNASVAGGLALVFFLVSPWIMRSYGAEFSDADGVLNMLLLAGVAIAIQLPAERVLTGLDYVWTVFWLNGIRGVLYVVMSLLLVPYGALGLAVARTSTSVLHVLGTLLVAHWIFRRLQAPTLELPEEYGDSRTFEPRSLEIAEAA